MTTTVQLHDPKFRPVNLEDEVLGQVKRSKVGAFVTPKVGAEVFQKYQDKIYGPTHGDWRDDFVRDGYAIVKGAIPTERALQYRQRMLDYLQTFDNPALDLNDRSTWIAENLPAHNKHGIFFSYACSHEDFTWDVRTEPGVIDAFAKLWGTDELLVSFDAFNVSFPGRPDKPENPDFWPHVDQSPSKKGLQCAQGIVNLGYSTEECDGTLVVVKGSTKFVSELFDSDEVYKRNWDTTDFVNFSKEEVDNMLQQGCELVRVKVEPGDLILWDSRTIHWGGEPTPDSKQIRTAVYASYTPREFATEETIALKARIFEKWLGTTHWAHDNLKPRMLIPILPDGTEDPRHRTEPKNKPEITDTILKLAGVKPY